MQVSKIKIHHLHIPLKLRFAQANNATNISDSVIMIIETSGAQKGYGECCPRLYVSGEDAAGVIRELRAITDELFAQNFPSVAAIEEWINSLLERGKKTAFACILELALLDAWSKEYKQPLVTALGGSVPQQWEYSGVIPFGNWDKLAKVLQSFQFKSVKFKAGNNLAANLERVSNIKGLYGQQTSIRIDANGAWSFEEAQEQISVLSKLGVESFEQPLPQGEEVHMTVLTQQASAEGWGKIMADESLSAYEDAAKLIEREVCQSFNLKLSKLGGILQSIKVYQLAQAHGISCQLGAHFGETSILTAAGMLLATVAQNLQHMEGGLGSHLLSEDICNPSLKIDQKGLIASQKFEERLGLGVEIDPLLITKYAHQSELWTR